MDNYYNLDKDDLINLMIESIQRKDNHNFIKIATHIIEHNILDFEDKCLSISFNTIKESMFSIILKGKYHQIVNLLIEKNYQIKDKNPKYLYNAMIYSDSITVKYLLDQEFDVDYINFYESKPISTLQQCMRYQPINIFQKMLNKIDLKKHIKTIQHELALCQQFNIEKFEQLEATYKTFLQKIELENSLSKTENENKTVI